MKEIDEKLEEIFNPLSSDIVHYSKKDLKHTIRLAKQAFAELLGEALEVPEDDVKDLCHGISTGCCETSVNDFRKQILDKLGV